MLETFCIISCQSSLTKMDEIPGALCGFQGRLIAGIERIVIFTKLNMLNLIYYFLFVLGTYYTIYKTKQNLWKILYLF